MARNGMGMVGLVVGLGAAAAGVGAIVWALTRPKPVAAVAAPPGVPAAPPAAPTGPAGWGMRVRTATSLSDLETVRSEFEKAYLTGQIDQATYNSLYSQYLTRFYALAGAPVPPPAPAPAPPPAPAPAAPPGPAGWPTRISQATSVAQLEAVRAEFEGAYLAKQIDQATYLALYNQYTARYAQVA